MSDAGNGDRRRARIHVSRYANDVKARINLGIRRRLAPLLGNDRKKIELLNLLLFSLPGTPVLYYGDEIGMGENIFLGDRNGVRTPMQWSSDKNAGFSRATPHALYLPVILDPEYHYESVNVEAQQRNPHSLLWWMKRAIHLRKRWHAFGQEASNFFIRTTARFWPLSGSFNPSKLLVVANLCAFRNRSNSTGSLQGFSACRTLWPNGIPCHRRKALPAHVESARDVLVLDRTALARQYELSGAPFARPLVVTGVWEEIFQERELQKLETLLPAYLRDRRWFGAKGREIKSARIREIARVPFASTFAIMAIVSVDYIEGEPEEYFSAGFV